MKNFLEDFIEKKRAFENNKSKQFEEKKIGDKTSNYKAISDLICQNIEKFLLCEKDPNFSSFVLDTSGKENEKITMIILVKEYFLKYWLKILTKINLKKEKISIYAFLSFRDGGEILVESDALRVLISRYFTRINFLLRYGAFYINNSNGQFGLKIISLMDGSIFEKDDKEKTKVDPKENKGIETEKAAEITEYSNLLDYLRNAFQNAKEQYDFHMVKILYLINQFKDGEYRSLEQDQLEGKFFELNNNMRKLNTDHMEKCRIIKTSLVKIDKELKTTDKGTETNLKENCIFWANIKEELKSIELSEKLDMKDLLYDYLSSVDSLFSAEEQFLPKYKDLSTLCKEERYLDEMTEKIDENYFALKKKYDLFIKKELDLFKDAKVINLKKFMKLWREKLENESKRVEMLPDVIDNEYKQLLIEILQNIDSFSETTSFFKMNKSSESKTEEITFNKTDKGDLITLYEQKQNISTELRALNISEETYKTLNEEKVLKDGNGSSFIDLERSLLEKYLGRKNLELNNELVKKKVQHLVDYALGLKKLKNEIFKYFLAEAKLIEKMYDTKDRKNSSFYEKYKIGKQILASYFESKERRDDFKKFEEYFKPPKSQSLKNAPSPYIYTEITKLPNNILSEKKILTSGGFADISRVTGEMTFVTNNNNTNVVVKDKILIMKSEKNTNGGGNDPNEKKRIIYEKKILENLKEEECPFIGKYYYNKEYNDLLFMEFYSYKSLDQFKLSYWPTISLNTKLFILYQTAQGVKFLKDKGIYHLDLKPGNILIHKNFVAKIIDFGESLKIDNTEEMKKHRPGRTLPFAPPEIFLESILYTPRIDVFSFGICVADLLFDEYLVDFRRSHLQNLQQKYFKGTYKARLYEEIVKTKGPKHLMKFLRVMILKSIEFEWENRATIEWIIILLRDSLGLLEKMY